MRSPCKDKRCEKPEKDDGGGERSPSFFGNKTYNLNTFPFGTKKHRSASSSRLVEARPVSRGADAVLVLAFPLDDRPTAECFGLEIAIFSLTRAIEIW